MQRIQLLGVPIDSLTMNDAVAQIMRYLEGTAQHHVMTPNNEMLVQAAREPHFHSLLRRSALNLPDSTGLLKAARWTKQPLPQRVTGIDTVTNLLVRLGPEHPVFLLGGGPGVALAAAEQLRRMNRELKIVGVFGGTPRAEDAEEIVERIKALSPHLLLVAFGAPQQDFWIDEHLSSMPSVRVAMGVGGTFDFLAGRLSRAPDWMQRSGFEWLWRLSQEPRRFKRIVRAVGVFPWLVLRHGKEAPRAVA
jgi:N-acetylglucosaminyldiphosphoundecaprenol N-acetyl-beta-D-mannosaminyltransferase